MSQDLMEDISIDCVLFGLDERLKVLLVKHASDPIKDKWALPGGYVTYEESLDDSAHRVLFALTGLRELFLEQLGAFGDVDRFPERRVVTVAYYSLVYDFDHTLKAGFTASEAQWFDVDNLPDLPYDHGKILRSALEKLKARVKQEPIGFNLLPEKFTLLQLQHLYESVLEIKFDKPNFRRKILKTGLLVNCNEKQHPVSYRAAKLYRFDELAYRRLRENKFVLDW